MTTSRVPTPLRRVYAYLLVATVLGRLPWWIATNLTPAQRPRKSWTLRKSVGVKLVRFFFSGLGRLKVVLDTHVPSHRKLEIGNGVEGVSVDGAPDLITGKVKEWAEKAGVEPIRLPGYWIHKKGTDIAMGQKSDEKEKVLYFLHGGAYVTLSAHPKQETSNIPCGFIEHCPSVKRTFAIEYRLSSELTTGRFPSALIDALSGYNYLVNRVGFAPSQVVIADDSAGGNLAQALTRYLAEYKGTVPSLPEVPGALVLLSPWTDMSGSLSSPTSSVFTNSNSDYIAIPGEPYTAGAPHGFIEPFGLQFTFQTPYLSPACKYLEDVSFDGFPRTFIAAGDAEVLLDQIRELSKRMKNKMGEDGVVYYEAKDAFHDYLYMDYAEPERSDTLRAISQFVEESKEWKESVALLH